ncbi:MAG: MucR family transcriptional regulator [Sphingobium sp.]|uniref:MucR family transcriptional regulator n=1 Tax=Sphingobium sp. TaxID=1912891 RepID=UPI003BB10021
MAEADQSDVMSLTVTLLSAYFANNTVPSNELPALVGGTRRALLGDAQAVAPAPERPTETPATIPEFKPAVTVDASLASPDQILSMIDGKPYKALKRHLAAHNLTPAEYRARYDLPVDYPMVAPGYSAARREVALKLGLGGKRKGVSPTATAGSEVAPVSEPPPSSDSVVDAAPVKPAPVRRPRTKATAATSAAKKPKRKVADGKAKPEADEATPKRKRSRTPKSGVLPTTPEEATPADAPAAE